jgi:type I restriction enzyme M protein
MTTAQIVSKVWNFCNILRDAGVSYGDYLEQLTFLIFLKMADEYAKPPHNRDLGIPSEYTWENLKCKRGDLLEVHYTKLLRELGKKEGMLGKIFTKSQNKIQDPAMLSRVIDMIDTEAWVSMSADVKGDIYEGLLEKNADDTKSGAGQYFTPRALTKAMVECLRPEPGKTISDPACGTGGFFLAAYGFIRETHKLNESQTQFLKYETFYGNEIVSSTYRLCLMNLFLHEIGEIDKEPNISFNDALVKPPTQHLDFVLANPPFGRKSSMTFSKEEKEQGEDLVYNRPDFDATTSNKQLNFIQHIRTMLKPTGKAAIVVPDNVLFEGGAGEIVRKTLLQRTNLHTILRLPTGIFYKSGLKANVIFFDNKPISKAPQTKEVWYYDFRTNVHFTLRNNPLKHKDLQDFVNCYNSRYRSKPQSAWSSKKSDGRWRKFTYEELIARDKTSLDIFWLRDDSLYDLDNPPEPDLLAAEIIENLEAGLNSFRAVLNGLSAEDA